MTVGRFENDLPIAPIRRISPSRATSLKKCILREVWSANKIGSFLPSSPVASLGTAIHHLLEDAGSGEISEASDSALYERFEIHVQKEAAVIGKHWFSKHFANLKLHIRDFEVRKIQAVKKAREIWIPPSGSTNKDSTPGGFERWIESKDKLIGGFIDQIEVVSGKVTIRDFKTGAILDDDTGAIKEDYRVQLALYAALYFEQNQQWPDRLELIGLNSAPVELKLSTDECLKELHSAVQMYKSVEEKIRKAMERSTADEAQCHLANLGAHCKFCQYRPACRPYLSKLSSDSTGNDVIGTVERVIRFGNGQTGIKLNSNGHSFLVRGLDSSQERHPALISLDSGNKVGIFNLMSSKNHSDKSETPYTVIYVYP